MDQHTAFPNSNVAHMAVRDAVTVLGSPRASEKLALGAEVGSRVHVKEFGYWLVTVKVVGFAIVLVPPPGVSTVEVSPEYTRVVVVSAS